VAEGPREKIEELLLKLNGQFGSFIRDQQVEWLEYRGDYGQFSII